MQNALSIIHQTWFIIETMFHIVIVSKINTLKAYRSIIKYNAIALTLIEHSICNLQ